MARAKSVPGNADKPPTTREITTLLGESYATFRALTERGSAVTREWKRYSSKSPWVVKVSEGERTPFYERPMVGTCRAVAVKGPAEVESVEQLLAVKLDPTGAR